MTSLIFLPVLTDVIENESLVCENQEEGTETIFLLDIDFTADKEVHGIIRPLSPAYEGCSHTCIYGKFLASYGVMNSSASKYTSLQSCKISAPR